MKKGSILLIVFIAIAVFLFFFYIFPLYKSAVEITKHKSRLNLISATNDSVKINLKPELYSGNGGIIPLNVSVTTGKAPVDLDMSDRSLIRFVAESRFKITAAPDKSYSIKLYSGGFTFNRNPGGLFKFIDTPMGKIELSGTSGLVSREMIALVSGSATLDGKKIEAKQVLVNSEIKPLDGDKIARIIKEISSLQNSKQKTVFANMFEYLSKFEDEVNANSRFVEPETPKETIQPGKEVPIQEPVKEEPTDSHDSSFFKDLMLKKTRVYADMYVLRMAVTYDRYFDQNSNFPASLADLNDEFAKSRDKDPWGTPYLYTVEGNEYFNLRSAGPDKQMNTGDDIILFDKKSPLKFWQL
jgi:hypothetical protein